ncbi:MAG: hypothetical protein CVU39_09010 [Chloroflexi bacterium HGW-Chloroflexi-10]|nr:MAG: hypothetical protein CVU39_09010 [Chloroflexi bacterium HGW-Chloroflexi-10]
MSLYKRIKYGCFVMLFSLLVAMFFFGQPPRIAQAIIATRYVKPDGVASGDCSTWAAACNLQYAISVATNSQEIWVMQGTYKPGTTRDDTFILKNGVRYYGGFSGNESSFNQRNILLNVTILSGDIGVLGNNADNSQHVVSANWANNATILDGFTISGGKSETNGGGLYSVNSSPLLRNLKFIGNSAVEDGAGVFLDNSQSQLISVDFIDNTSERFGGGLYVHNSMLLFITNAVFLGNSAVTGGGIYIEDTGISCFARVTFQENTAGFSSGAMYAYGFSGNMQVVSFDRNSAVLSIGGMNLIQSSPTINNITFSGNSALYGGALGIQGGTPELKHITLTNNLAGNSGGAIYLYDTAAEIKESIIWGNSAPSAPEIYLDTISLVPTLSNNVLKTGCPTASNCSAAILSDPMLGLLASHGTDLYGATPPTIPLLFGSSAIDTGNDSECSAFDQRNIERPLGDHCDIGAYESREFTVALNGGNQYTAIGSPFKDPLKVRISSSFGDPVNGSAAVFTAPASGASAAPAAQTVQFSGGEASANFSANQILGAYIVRAQIGNITIPFPLLNGPAMSITTQSNPTLYQQPLVITVQVSDPGGTPTGTLELYDADTLIATQTLVDGTAVFNLPDISGGYHYFEALYSGDASFLPSRSAVIEQFVYEYGIFLPVLIQ